MFEFLNDYAVLISALLSALISYLVALLTSKTEIRKIKLTQKHELQNKIYSTYSNLISKTAEFVQKQNGVSKDAAQTALSNFLPFAPKELFALLKELDEAISKSDFANISLLRNELMSYFEKFLRTKINS